MKLMPRSIAGRTAWVLTAGFIIVIIGSVIVSSVVIRSKSHESTLIEVATKIIMLTSLLNSMDTNSRVAVIESFSDKNIQILRDDALLSDDKVMDDWGTNKMQKHLQAHMSSLVLHGVSVAHPKHERQSGAIDKSSIVVTVVLRDDTKIQFVARSPHQHYQMIMYVLFVLVFIIVGIYILSVIVTRQIVKPLKQFSAASTRFSTDLFSPALEQAGPVEIEQAAAAFNLMQDRIRRFVNERTHMLAAISHDLRTPLTRLRLRAESISDKDLQKKSLQDISDMQSMLDSTLSFARDEASAETSTAVDLATLVKSICDDEADAGHKVEYTGPEHLNFTCRPVAMKRVLNNLVGNAIKYAGDAKVQLSEKDNTVLIEVSDYGPGIPREQLDKVFSPFYRVEASRNRDTGGTGLGLTVARTIVRAHGGEITINNSSKGLAVVITLPRI